MTNVNHFIKNANVKRRIAKLDTCLIELQDELQLIFQAYDEACSSYNLEIVFTPPQARCRGFEASLFNSKMIQAIQKHFPLDWHFGKYKRFILTKKGYLVLFKKFDNKGYPMNIRTKFVENINLQLTGSLFEGLGYVEEPILYFGYKKDNLGRIINPQIVYIDEYKIKWVINEADIVSNKSIISEKASQEIATPKLRVVKKKAVNE